MMLIPLSYEGTETLTREGALAAQAVAPPTQRTKAQATLVNNFFIEIYWDDMSNICVFSI